MVIIMGLGPLVTSVMCCFEVYKNVGEKPAPGNQLTHYELEEFFRSPQDLLVL